jgi:hypothetical protein
MDPQLIDRIYERSFEPGFWPVAESRAECDGLPEVPAGEYGIRIWNRSRLHYLRVQAFGCLMTPTAFIQFAEALVSIRGRVSILRASLGGARQILLWNCLITSRS